MHNGRFVLVALALYALCAPAWAVVKCTMPDGKVVYQETACAVGTGAKVNTSGAGQGDPYSQTANHYAREAARIDAKEAAERAARDHASRTTMAVWQRKVMPGMTAEEARRSWGDPMRVNTSVGSYGRHEQWVYPNGQYIYVQDGLVTGAQSTK